MNEKLKKKLEEKANKIRIDIIEMICNSKSGHPGGALSVTDIITYLYFSGTVNINLQNYKDQNRDRIILSKGHSCPALYAALAELNFFDKSELLNLRKYGSMLQGHPDMKSTPGIEMSTGSLGQGLSVGVGMALGAKMENIDCNIFVILGDGEIQEGQVWEAAMSASHYKLNRLIAIIDNNGLQIDGFTEDIMNIKPIGDKWRAFGWKTIEINGHDFYEIDKAIRKAIKNVENPTCIIANTIKGKGVSLMENKCEWHGKSPSLDQKNQCIKELSKI